MRDRHGWVTSAAIGLGAVVGVAGCTQQTTDVQMSEGAALSGFNGLAAMNGLAGLNGLTGLNGLAGLNGQANANGLSALNGLAGLNGLAAMNGLMTTDGGRKTVAYLVKCALASNDSLTKQDQNGTSYTFPGGLNLCPAWKTSGISGDN